MAENTLIEKSGLQIRLGSYATANATMLRDPSILPRVQDYRRLSGGRMYPLDRNDIARKIPTADFHVSRKIDGEFTVLYFDSENLFSLNPGGTVRVGMPWQDEAEKLLRDSGIKQAMFAGELHVDIQEDRRARVHDVVRVARQPGDDDDLNRLRFAVFDIVELDGEPHQALFAETWSRIESLFGQGERIQPVESRRADSAHIIENIFAEWVEQEGAEGVVVRSDSAGMFKIKPRYTLDAAVIGFTESTDDRTGMMHDVLVAIVRNDGAVHVLGRVGGGFTDDQRREMLSDLKDMVVASEYAEVNSDHVAYQMVKPEWVIEISCLDLIAQTTRGAPVNRMALNWNSGEQRYEVIRRLPLVSVISPQFVRRREDKSVNPQDVRIDQIAAVVEVPMADRDATQMALPKSEVIRREVYTKELKGEMMVRKFLMWKTNKENESDEFPAYVLHYTDFSPNRKVPLAREVRVSNSLEQIEAFWISFKEEYIKQGWGPVQ
ncbi:MAG: hypothetical protein ACR2NP_12930 [Pirellulaceae bacterium]